jgi:hypothetical protein
MKIERIDATIEHAETILANIRVADAAEIFAMGVQPEIGLRHSLKVAVKSWTVTFDGQPALIFGVGTKSLIGNTGVPWMLSTHLIDQHPTAFARYSLMQLRAVRAMFPHLENIVDARYARCIRWLQFLGFHVEPPEPMGPYGLPFHRFHMGAEHGT